MNNKNSHLIVPFLNNPNEDYKEKIRKLTVIWEKLYSEYKKESLDMEQIEKRYNQLLEKSN